MIFREIRTSNSFKDFPYTHWLSTWLFSSCTLHMFDDFCSDCVVSRTRVDKLRNLFGGNMLTRDRREFLNFLYANFLASWQRNTSERVKRTELLLKRLPFNKYRMRPLLLSRLDPYLKRPRQTRVPGEDSGGSPSPQFQLAAALKWRVSKPIHSWRMGTIGWTLCWCVS